MKKSNKLRSRKGETLVETLVSILAVSIIAVGLGTMIMAAAQLNGVVADHDKKLYTQIQNMENTLSTDTPSAFATANPSTGENMEIQFREAGSGVVDPSDTIKIQVTYYEDKGLGRLITYFKK